MYNIMFSATTSLFTAYIHSEERMCVGFLQQHDMVECILVALRLSCKTTHASHSVNGDDNHYAKIQPYLR